MKPARRKPLFCSAWCLGLPGERRPRGSAHRWARSLSWLSGILLLALLGIVSASEAGAEGIRVVYEDGREQERIPVWSVDEIPYLSVNDVGRILGATKQWNSETKKMVLRSGDSQTTLTLESPVVLAGEDARRSLHPVRMRRGILQIPLDLATRVLPESFGQAASWDPATGTLRVGTGQSNVARPRFKRLPRGIRTILPLTESLEYSMDPEAVGGFQLTLKGAKADPDQISRTLHRGFVKRVSASQRSDGMVILFIPDRNDLQARVITRKDPDQVVVDITAPDDHEVPSPSLKPRWALSPDEILGRGREGWVLELVVIDPGHGGVDTGARGVSGLEEKQVVLEIARQLEIMLEDRSGIEAVLTRERDEFVPLRQRTEMANTLDADLFVSIHCNASRDPGINGFEVYFQSLEMGEEEQLVAEFENAVLALEGETSASAEGDLPFILWDLAQNAFMAESSDFADLVQGAVGNGLSTRNRGVKQANFVVLRGAHMPAVLIEGAFTSNESEESLLRSPYFQQLLAEGLYEGIMQFKARYEGRK